MTSLCWPSQNLSTWKISDVTGKGHPGGHRSPAPTATHRLPHQLENFHIQENQCRHKDMQVTATESSCLWCTGVCGPPGNPPSGQGVGPGTCSASSLTSTPPLWPSAVLSFPVWAKIPSVKPINHKHSSTWNTVYTAHSASDKPAAETPLNHGLELRWTGVSESKAESWV